MKKILFIILILSIGCTNNENCNLETTERIEKLYDLELDLDVTFNDLGELRKCSKLTGKPILTIYGSYFFASPKSVWQHLANKEINEIISTRYLLRYYYVDDKKTLPDSLIKKTGIKSYGEFFSQLQIDKYKTNIQPLYTITNWQEKDLTEPIEYVPKNETAKFKKFIEKGLNNPRYR